MVIFILIFFALVIAVGASAVLGFSFYLKRRTAKSLQTNNQNKLDVPYRSLFEPDDEDVRAFEPDERSRARIERQEIEREISFECSERAREFEKIWRGEPNRRKTVEFLRLAAASESAEIFSRAAENVIRTFKNERTGGLSAKDLADLLDSHFRTLPQQERFSGAVFWLKREIERLRAETERL